MRIIKELVPYAAHSPSFVSVCLVFILAQTNKRQRTHLPNSSHRKRRRKNFIALFCRNICNQYDQELLQWDLHRLEDWGNTRQMSCNPSKPKFHHRNLTKQTKERIPADLPSPWTTPSCGELQQTLFNVQFSVALRPQKNRRFIRDGSSGRPPRLSHSSSALLVVNVCLYDI